MKSNFSPFALLIACTTCRTPLSTIDATPTDASVSEATPPTHPGPTSCRDDAGVWHLPNPEWTPGKLCTASDPTFKEWRYGERVAVCVRYVTMGEKDRIAARYGVAKTDYKTVEFDHYIPLSAGGSDDDQNIWPQRLEEAKQKDRVEVEVYNALSAGEIDQDEAVARIRAWRPAFCPTP